MSFWVFIVAVLAWDLGGGVVTGKLRRKQVIICRQEKLADFWIKVVADVAWVIYLCLARNSFVVFLVPIYLFGLRYYWKIYKTHKDHDEDCIYGPRRRYGKAGSKIKIWWTPKTLPVPA